MLSSQSKRKRLNTTSKSRPSSSTQQESRELLLSHASENSPELDPIIPIDDDYDPDEDIDAEDPPPPSAENAEDEVGAPSNSKSKSKKGKKMKKRALFWKSFKEIMDSKGETVRDECIFCKVIFAAHSKHNGTTNLSKHWKTCEQNPDTQSKGTTQTTLNLQQMDAAGNCMVTSNVLDLEVLRTKLCRLVIGEEIPFNFVQKFLFRDMMTYACPTFTVPSRSTVTRDACKMYAEAREKLKLFFQQSCQRVCLTTDTWTSIQTMNYMVLTAHFIDNHWNLQKRILNFCPISGHKADEIARDVEDCPISAPGRISFTTDNWRSENTWNEYMCVTAHWIDKDWKLQKRMVKFSSLDPPFDGASLADEILLCLGEWKISEKVFTFTLDNASYNDTMIASLKSHLLRKHSLVLHGEFFHMRCCCHIINLVVQAGLRGIDDVVVKIRKIVINLRNSIPKRKKFYEIACTNFGLNSTKRLRLDVCTRWNSTFTMLDRFLYFQEAVDSFVSKDLELRVHRLSLVEWEKVRELHEFLQAFYDTTNDFSASNTPTANVYFNGVWTIHTLLTKCAEGPVTVLSPMVIEMQAKFEKYWTDYNLLLSCADVLDPRHKFEGVRYCYASLFGDVYAKEMMDKIKGVLSDLLDEYRLTDVAETNDIEVVHKFSNDSARRVSNATMNPRAALFDHLSKRKKTGKSNLKSELELYFEFDDDSFSATDDIDILEFWKENSRRLPTLAALARDILCIPISSVPSESAFSLGKKLIRATRSSLASTTIEALSCYEDWLRARGFILGPSKMLKIGDEGSEDIKDGDDEEKD